VSVRPPRGAAPARAGGAAYAPYWVIACALAIVTVVAVRRLRPAQESSTADGASTQSS